MNTLASLIKYACLHGIRWQQCQRYGDWTAVVPGPVQHLIYGYRTECQVLAAAKREFIKNHPEADRG